MNNKYEYKVDRHPLSAAFPDMSPEEYSELLDSVKKIGILNPIVMFEGMIIDGWHRYKASVELDIECPADDLPEDIDPCDFVIAQNISRRSLTASQRALAVVMVNSWRPRGKPKTPPQEVVSKTKSNADMVEISNTSKKTIENAKFVAKNAIPEVIEAVQAGEIGIVKAAQIAKLGKEKQADALKQPVAKKKAVPKQEQPTDYDPSDDAKEALAVLNEELDKAQRAAAAGVLGEGMESAAQIMERQAEEIKTLRAENDGLKATRDTMMVEIRELKKQCAYYQKKMKELAK